jgi:hypothetical protein
MGAQGSNACCHAEVYLNIYDVGGTSVMRNINDVLRGFGTGVYHTGIQVYNTEWSFAALVGEQGDLAEGTGVVSNAPRKDENHRFRESVFLGYTTKSEEQVITLLNDMKRKWRSENYDLLRNNCQSFCARLCQELCGDNMPEPTTSWVTSMAKVGNIIDTPMVFLALSSVRVQSCASDAAIHPASQSKRALVA